MSHERPIRATNIPGADSLVRADLGRLETETDEMSRKYLCTVADVLLPSGIDFRPPGGRAGHAAADFAAESTSPDLEGRVQRLEEDLAGLRSDVK